MNRLELPTEPIAVPTHTVTWEAPANKSPLRVVGIRQRDESTAAAASFAPLHYEKSYAYPLVVWLHGMGQDSRSLGEVMTHISTRNYVAVAPQSDASTHRGSASVPWGQTPTAIVDAHARIDDAISFAKQRFSIHPRRVFLVGFGGGGTMALRVALQNPAAFAGVATLGGPLPNGHCPLSRVNSIRSLPLLIAASRHSNLYPEHQVCSDLRLLHSAGATISLRQYPGADDLTSQMLADLDHWMMELVGQTNAAVVY